jgi:cathepsin A (carboxypeptidase C)
LIVSLTAVSATPYLKLQNPSFVDDSSSISASAIIEEDVGAWTKYSHSSYPGYSVRVNNQESKLCDTSVGQKVGYLDADGKHFFFWFFESRSKPADDPLILWLNGGPGCSSLTGLLMELGPCRVNPTGNGTTFNPYSWNTNANIIFLDQPVEVGFSYSDDSTFPTNSVDGTILLLII